MALEMLKDKGVPLCRQRFSWKDLVQTPISKLDVDAFTRVRIILMNGIESEQNRFLHACARMNRTLQEPLAQVRRVEQHQQTMINWLNPPDQSPLDTTIGYEQTAIELTASIAQAEPDPELAQVYRFGLLEDFDHLYRFSALMDRVEGKDANNILQSYTDIIPGRPTWVEHRAPEDDLRNSYERTVAAPLSKLHALTIVSAENQVHDYYMNVGPFYADPLGRQLYAEIASIEEQHVTQYESLMDPSETWIEKWLLHEANEVYTYYSCLEFEHDQRIKSIWERFLDYELGHLQFVSELFKRIEGRDPAELLPAKISHPIQFKSQREFVRQTLSQEVDYRAQGTLIGRVTESAATLAYRQQVNSEGSPSEIIAAGYRWAPSTELARPDLIDSLIWGGSKFKSPGIGAQS